MPQLQGRLALVAAACLFSTGGTVIKLTELDGFQVAAGRSAIAFVVLYALLPAWRRFWQPRTLVVGASYAATMVLFVLASKQTTAANAIFLQGTFPLYVLFLAPWLLGERTRALDVALTGGILVGLLLLFTGQTGPLATAPNPSLGNLLGAAAGVTWACTLVGLRWLAILSDRGADLGADQGADQADRNDARAGSSGRAIVAGNLIALAICIPFTGIVQQPLPTLSVGDVVAVAWLGVFQIAFAYVWLSRAVATLPTLEVALLLLLEPVMSAAIAWWVHGETLGPSAIAGCALILASSTARSLLAERAGDRLD